MLTPSGHDCRLDSDDWEEGLDRTGMAVDTGEEEGFGESEGAGSEGRGECEGELRRLDILPVRLRLLCLWRTVIMASFK